MKRIVGVRATVPPPPAREVDEEFEFHLATKTQRLIDAGWDPGAARAEAARQFGDVNDAVAYCREMDRRRATRETRTQSIADIGQDLRFGIRALRKAPGFLIVAVLTLGLGIGANVAVFGMLRGVLIDPIPVPRPHGLVALFQTNGPGQEPVNQISYGDYVDLRARMDLFEDVALMENASATIVDDVGPDRVQGLRASPALFRLLGVRPVVGRAFDAADAAVDEQVVVVSYDYWSTRLGGAPSAVGKTIRIGGEPHTIVGVMPPNVDLPYPSRGTQLWRPLNDAPDRTTNRQYWGYWAIARPAAATTPERLQSELDALGRSLARAHPASNTGRGFTARDLATTITGDRRIALSALVGGALFVLLIACTNLTNLLLVRAVTRRREVAIRAALGSGSTRIVRGLAVETLLVALAGGLAGTGLAALVLRAVAGLGQLPATHVDARMILLAGGLAVVVGLTCGIWPAMVAVRGGTHDALRASSRASLGRDQRRVADVLVAAEVALGFVLLVSAALMVLTVARALGENAGFDRRNVLAFRVFPARDRYPDVASTMSLYRRVVDAVEAIPGAATPVFSSALPLGNRMGSALTRDDRPLAVGASAPTVTYAAVWPGYFRLMGIAVLAGRDFEERDITDSTHVTIISERTARELFEGENPIGKRITLGNPDQRDWHTIVGIVADVRQDSVTGQPERGAYDVYGQHWNRGMYVIVRASAPAPTLIAAIRARLRLIDPELPMYEVATMDERAASSIVNRRFLLRILAVFSGIAIVLCGVGIYGVTAQAVAQRRRELGIRMALGASSRRVQRGVVGRAALVVAVGLGMGLVGAIAITRLLRALVYGVATTDAAAFAGGALSLAIVALASAWLPSRRASRVDPVEVLRTD